MDFTITRSARFPYLFDLTLTRSGRVYRDASFETIQRILGVEPEDYARIDDGRYMLLL